MSDPAINEPVILAGIEQQEVVPAVLAPGAQLAAQRQARGWSVEEVAMQLNLAPRQIQAIEADNYAALPGIASVRGFIRGYAKVLRIDAAPLLTMISNETAKLSEPMPQRKALSEPFSETRLPSMGRQGLPSKAIFVAGIVVLLLVALFIGQQMGSIQGLQESVSSIIKDVTPATAPLQNAPAAVVSQSAVESPSVVAAQSGTSSATSEAIAPSVPVVGAVAATGGEVAAVEATALSSKNALVLELHADSWLEIRRADRTTMVSRLLKAGTTETIEISEPVSMTIGNVSGVDATWRGEPLDIKSGTKTNVIRLNLK